MTRSQDSGIADGGREELMRVGAKVIEEIKELLWNSSSAIKTNFRHDVKSKPGGTEDNPTNSLTILLFFTITNLGGSKREDIEKLIEERLRFFFTKEENLGYKTFWSFEVATEE